MFPNHEFAFAYNLKTKRYYKFEETGLVIWNFIAENEPIDEHDLILKVADYYGIGKETVELDVEEFLASLFEKGLINYNG